MYLKDNNTLVDLVYSSRFLKILIFFVTSKLQDDKKIILFMMKIH